MATGTLAETVVEEVASNLEEAAEVTRRINPRSIGLVLGGVGIGVAVGFFFGYRYNREKIRAEAFAKSEEEVEKIRELYRDRAKVVVPEKPSVEQVVEERGYLDPERERPLPTPVPFVSEPDTTEPPIVVDPDRQVPEFIWNYPHELARRSPDRPYVIHQEEFQEEGSQFNHVTYTYFAEDGFVMNDEDQQLFTDVDARVGLHNLVRFGHGTDDPDIVFIRNHELNIEIELARTYNSYQRDIEGLEPDDAEPD
jgi:hypothetical protein